MIYIYIYVCIPLRVLLASGVILDFFPVSLRGQVSTHGSTPEKSTKTLGFSHGDFPYQTGTVSTRVSSGKHRQNYGFHHRFGDPSTSINYFYGILWPFSIAMLDNQRAHRQAMPQWRERRSWGNCDRRFPKWCSTLEHLDWSGRAFGVFLGGFCEYPAW